MEKEDIEKRDQRNFELGISEGLKRASNQLKARSQDKFSLGNDEQAKMLRTLSNSFMDESKNVNPGPPTE